MSSPKNLDVDFERDMPLTEADIAALDRARQHAPLSTEAYLQWLSLMRATNPPRERELNSDTDPPFELP
jgi:hypothetical protein